MRRACECWSSEKEAPRLHDQEEEEENDAEAEEARAALEQALEAAGRAGSVVFRLGQLEARLFFRIASLPRSVAAQLQAVRVLDCSNSNVAWMPRELGQVAALEELNVRGCYRLHWLPFELLCLPRLRVVHLHEASQYGVGGKGFPALACRWDPSLQLLCAARVAALPAALAAQLEPHLERCCRCGRRTARIVRSWVRRPVCAGGSVATLLAVACSRECLDACGGNELPCQRDSKE